ncbi:hypothetical protein Scep_009174 [Stephania cephalantha]|uniref:F-box domain-containing protein n=1 Tax=Stephania cephalantha TaxID=152367 RepID=A0AAP0PCA8_9MAGN
MSCSEVQQCGSPLPDDVFAREILVRLPVKSLVRFKSVCKAWRAMITDHDFTEMHLHHQLQLNQQLNILFTYSDKIHRMVIKSTDSTVQCDDIALKELEHSNYPYPRFWGYCNGLVCLETDTFELALWNPGTQFCRRLRYRPIYYHNFDSISSAFATAYGFGYDGQIKDYKMVAINPVDVVNLRGHCVVDVLTLGDNSWRRIAFINLSSSSLQYQSGKFIKGIIYWNLNILQPEKLICFDIHYEVFNELRLPNVFYTENIFNGRRCKIEISELGGRLAVVRELQPSSSYDFFHEVWVMKEDWVKMYSIDESQNSYLWSPSVSLIGSFGIIEDKKKKKKKKKKNHFEIVYMNNRYGELFSYNPSTEAFRDFNVRVEEPARSKPVLVYVESLVSLDQ